MAKYTAIVEFDDSDAAGWNDELRQDYAESLVKAMTDTDGAGDGEAFLAREARRSAIQYAGRHNKRWGRLIAKARFTVTGAGPA